MTEKMRKPENKGRRRSKQPLSRVMRNSGVSIGLLGGLMGASSSEKLDISVPQKLVEANALVKTEEWVTDEDVSNLLEKEDSRGDFRIIRDDRYGNPKVVVRTETEKGDEVEFVLEITSNKHEKNVSEILEDLGGAVSEDFIGRVELIEMAHRVSILTNKPKLAEDTIMLMLDERPLGRPELDSMSDELRMAESVLYVHERERTVYNAVRSTYLEKVLRDPNFMSDPSDWIKDDVY